MKVTLISPYPNINTIGIRILSAYLKKKAMTVQLIFLLKHFKDRYEGKTLDEIIELSRESDLIGISLMTNFFDNVIQITKKIKENLSIPVVWGGIHPTIRPDECLEYADIVCLGEAEETLAELVSKVQDAEDFHSVQGIGFKEKGKVVINKLRPLILDLNSIPFPDYDFKDHYILNGGTIRKIDKDLLMRKMGRDYMTIPTRGCPFGCTYCCNNALNSMYPHQESIRKRSVDSLIEELVIAKSNLPFIERIVFDDDAFFIYTEEEIIDFAKKYKENIRLPLIVTGLNPLTFSRKNLSVLVDAGLKSIRMGIQTGNERAKGLYKRYYSNEQVQRAVKVINDFKDKIRHPQYDIILDNPWETDEDLIETLMFLATLPAPYYLSLYSLTFYPGTELYEKAKREGIIADDSKEVYHKYLHSCKTTYLNRLFFLLRKYAVNGKRLSTGMISLLTNRKLRQLRLNWLLYVILRIWIIPFNYLLWEGLKDVRKGDWSRIIRYINKYLNR